MNHDVNLFSLIASKIDTHEYRELNWQGTFHDYLGLVNENRDVARNAFQRVYDMIQSYGTRETTYLNRPVTHFNFFDDPSEGGKEAVFGLDGPLQRLVNFFKSAAHGYGTEKRVLLLHGPVGSSKSTIVRLLKRGLERYSRTPEGALFTFEWQDEKGEWVPFPTHADLEQSVFELTVAGRRNSEGGIDIMMVEAGSTPNGLRLIAAGDAPSDEATVARPNAHDRIRFICSSIVRDSGTIEASECDRSSGPNARPSWYASTCAETTACSSSAPFHPLVDSATR